MEDKQLYPIYTSEKETGALLHDIYLFDDIESPREFTDIINLLNSAQEQDEIIFHINTLGGSFYSALALIDAINNTLATTLASLSGVVASAGTIIALAVDGIRVSNGLEFMSHYYTTGYWGKGNELEAQAEFSIPHMKKVFRELYKDFYTKKEITRIIRGEDSYLSGDEVIARWENVIAKREAEINKDIKKQSKAQIKSTIEYLESEGYSVTPRD